jgi:hypothetical protein
LPSPSIIFLMRLEMAWMPKRSNYSFLWALSAKNAVIVPAELLLIFKRPLVDTIDTIILKKPKQSRLTHKLLYLPWAISLSSPR